MQTLIFYMKSGNKIIADKVIEWKVKYNSTDGITYLFLDQKTTGFFRCKNEVQVSALCLSQIEAIVTK